VLRIINEPTAAALAYGLEKKKNETILVFDLGGGTFDVSILDVGEGVCEVRSTSGDTHLGGDDFDKRVVDWIAEEFKKESGIDIRNDRQALQRLYEAAEKAKCELSSMAETQVNLPFITADASGPKHLVMKITRAKFEDLVHDLVERCMKPVEQALADARLTAGDIDEVILVGGSTRMPMVQALIEKQIGKAPNRGVNPDEVVAVGAALQAGVLSGEVRDMVLLDVTPLSLGVETLGGLFTSLIERNTTIPTSRSRMFTTAVDNQSTVDIHVLQGEREFAADNISLGRFQLTGIPPAPRGAPRIDVAFEIDVNGIAHVSARDTSTGNRQGITVRSSTSLSKTDIERLVREAQQHRQEDGKRAEMQDLRNRADAVIYSAERAIRESQGLVDETALASVRGRVAAVRSALDSSDMNTIRPALDTLSSEVYALVARRNQAAAAGTTGAGASPGAEEAADSVNGAKSEASDETPSGAEGFDNGDGGEESVDEPDADHAEEAAEV